MAACGGNWPGCGNTSSRDWQRVEEPVGPLKAQETLTRLRQLTEERPPRPRLAEVKDDFQTWRVLSAFQALVEGYRYQPRIRGVGTVLHIGDGIAVVSGVRDAMVDELLEFPGGLMGLAFDLDRETIGCALLGPEEGVKAGDQV